MMSEDKTRLLRSLKIDRSTEKAERRTSRSWLPISAVIVACVVGAAAFAAFEFRKDDPWGGYMVMNLEHAYEQEHAESGGNCDA